MAETAITSFKAKEDEYKVIASSEYEKLNECRKIVNLLDLPPIESLNTGLILGFYRCKLGLTQSALSKLAKVDKNTVSDLESNQRKIQPRTAKKLAKVLGEKFLEAISLF